MKLTDFHTHTYLSDGVLGPAEHLRRLVVQGLDAVAITDHVDSSTIDHVLNSLDQIRYDFEEHITFLPGVEITHVLPSQIPELARKAKQRNFLVVVHGETIVEPVVQGTNEAAVKCPDVDILAHPGILTFKEAKWAEDNEVFLEITTRCGHSLGNGLVAELALKTGAKMVLNTDSHAPRDFISHELRDKTALGSGIPRSMFEEMFVKNPEEIIKRIIK
ncbi:MAG: histidinol phosphate phosphatase domain-containing protein [Candidatus Heimdallarchaeota archaeon]|nr:histidinol phosphate phosphatase domain-containing protein [Candidatus Heimdallarchaeota archaeon]